jgi:hypothetical protein
VARHPPYRRHHLLALLIAAAALFPGVRPASADVILGAVAGTINLGGPGFGTLTETFDQSGLSSTYVSGVTDFDAYLATGPTHTPLFFPFEWFSNAGTIAASATYDLGAVHTIGRVALWNEDAAGIGLLSLFGSQDGVGFSPLSLDLSPTNRAAGQDYGVDVFGFAAAQVRYIRFDMSACPQPDISFVPACGVGEVAFAAVPAAVPEPASIALLGLGLTAVAVWRRRRSTH